MQTEIAGVLQRRSPRAVAMVGEQQSVKLAITSKFNEREQPCETSEAAEFLSLT
jgi:hypothetical protein